MEILATLDASVLDTVAAAPGETIVPDATTPTGALELLRELSSASPAASLQLRTGDVLGIGGMGVVRAAEQVALGRTVAVKTLKPERREQAAALDLLREAWVTGAIEHPNVVPVYYLGFDPDGSPLIVMKRVEGVEWSALIRDGQAVEQRFGATDLLAWNVGILMQVLNALRFAHHRGVIHRDVKPSNVMIGDFGEVYLLDWGIAVSLRDNGSGRLPLAKNATELAGTPCYMAPEMLGAEHGVPLSERTDIYLAGAVLFEIVTGAPPHTGKSALEVLASVVESTPVVPPGVPTELARLCTDAMHADPAERVESAEAFRLALQRYLEHRGSAELAARALARLDELRAALAVTPPDRDHIYRLFNACRFGFHEALAGWRDNAEARDGLARATIAVAEYELATDHAAAAVTLLGELDEPPPLLARAKAAAAAGEQRAAKLEALGKQHDTTRGRRTRAFLMVLFGVLFSAIPLLLYFQVLGLEVTHRSLLAWSAGAEVLIIGLAVWARQTLTATLLNRRLIGTAMMNFVLQIALVLTLWTTDVPIELTFVLTQFLWAVIGAMLALAVDIGLTPAAIAYLAGFVVSAHWPSHSLLFAAASNFVMGVNGAIRWLPDSFRLTDEERAWLGRKD